MSSGVDEQASREVALSNIDFAEILGLAVHPDWRGGLIRVGANLHHGATLGRFFLYSTAYVDVRVVGYIGSTPEAIHRGALGEESGTIDVVFAEVQSYRRIAVLARLLIDGTPGRVVPPPALPSATAHAIARFNRA